MRQTDTREDAVVLHTIEARPDPNALRDWRKRFEEVEAALRRLLWADAPPEGDRPSQATKARS
jgi:hypothetical protein